MILKRTNCYRYSLQKCVEVNVFLFNRVGNIYVALIFIVLGLTSRYIYINEACLFYLLFLLIYMYMLL